MGGEENIDSIRKEFENAGKEKENTFVWTFSAVLKMNRQMLYTENMNVELTFSLQL